MEYKTNHNKIKQAKQKQTHRYREHISDYQKGSGVEEGEMGKAG